MAIATSGNWYANAIVGQPQAGADIDIHARDTSAKYAVGFGFVRSDGNVYRYVQYGAAVHAGNLVGLADTNNNLASTNALVVAPATSMAIAGELVKAGAKNSRYVEITLATVASNQFAGGTLAITKDTGIGATYRIKGNTATGSPTSGNFRVELYSPLVLPLDNTTDIAIASSKYAGVISNVPVEGTFSNVIGVTQNGATSGNYGWICTRGITACLTTATNVGIGNEAAVSLMSGAYIQSNTITALQAQKIGVIVVAGAAGQMGILDLQLE